MSASLAAQRAHRGLLIASSSVTALVPAADIIDSSAALDRFPAIILGESQELALGDVANVNKFKTLYHNVHCWAREPGLAEVKAIAGAVEDALAGTTWTADGWQCLQTQAESVRYLRDSDGETSHAVLTLKLVLVRQ
jgi:hypothetical protein